MNIQELIKHHRDEANEMRKRLEGWQRMEAPNGDEKCKRDSIEKLEALVKFHEATVAWLCDMDGK